MVRRLLLLNGFSILGVILYHSAGWGFVAMFSWTHRYMPVSSPNFDQLGSISYFGLRVIEQLVVFTIPAFLFVSGFFVAFATGRIQSNIKWETIAARIKRMLIPYLIWTFALFGLLYIQGNRYSLYQYMKMLLIGQTNPAYYYVPLLIQFYLLSPIIVPFAKRNWKTLLLLTGLIQLAVQLSYYPTMLGLEGFYDQIFQSSIPKWFFPVRIFWFSFGVVAGFRIKSIKELVERYKWYLLILVLVLIPIGIIEWEYYLNISGKNWVDPRETFIDTVYSLAIILCFLAFDQVSFIPFSKQINDLGSKSFGIYITHSPIMEYTARTIYHLIPWILAFQIIFQPILILAGLGLPLLLMTIVNKTPARRYYQYLFG
jgi:hypothetical protein